MTRSDVTVAALFLALSAGLLVGGELLPAGSARAPGPGFFPVTIGLLMAALSAGLLWQGLRGRGAEAVALGDTGMVAAIAVLTFVYLMLWGSGLFALRTALFLALFLRIVGQSWKSAAAVSVALTLGVVAAFQYGLSVSLE